MASPKRQLDSPSAVARTTTKLLGLPKHGAAHDGSENLGGEPTIVARPVKGLDYNDILNILNSTLAVDGDSDRQVAIFFGQPDNELVKKILPKIPYWHHRSGSHIDVFCVGFSSSPTFVFDGRRFKDTIEQFERETRYKYSGGTDLVLMRAYRKSGQAFLDPSAALAITLETAIRDEAVLDIGLTFEQIIRQAKKVASPNSVSNGAAMQLLVEALKECLLWTLPEVLRKPFKKAFHWVVRNISKRKR